MIWYYERSWEKNNCFELFWLLVILVYISGSILYSCVSMVTNFKFEIIFTHPKKTTILCYNSKYLVISWLCLHCIALICFNVWGTRRQMAWRCFILVLTSILTGCVAQVYLWNLWYFYKNIKWNTININIRRWGHY